MPELAHILTWPRLVRLSWGGHTASVFVLLLLASALQVTRLRGKAICYVTQHLDTGAGRGLILSSPASAPAQHCITITQPDTDNLRLWSLFHSRFLCQSYPYFHRMIWCIMNLILGFWMSRFIIWRCDVCEVLSLTEETIKNSPKLSFLPYLNKWLFFVLSILADLQYPVSSP